jgi:hypothetical protein
VGHPRNPESCNHNQIITMPPSAAEPVSNGGGQQGISSEETSGNYGYESTGKKKRILLNAFDMNGLGHIR